MRKSPTGGFRRMALDLAAPAAQELAKTVLLLVLMMLTLWVVLEIFAGPTPGSWLERLGSVFAEAGKDVNGRPIAPRFWAAAWRSMLIVLVASALLGALALAAGSAFAIRPGLSLLRWPLVIVSAVPAFMFPFLGVPRGPSVLGDWAGWLGWSGVAGEPIAWPALCLAIGDLNAAALTAHCYEGVRRELNQPYVRTARAQGLPAWSDLWPKATLITLEGLRARLPHLLGGTVALEWAYNIHGVGNLALNAVLAPRPDYHVLVWVAGLGIVATRVLSLVHRLARLLLTPERGKAADWSRGGLGSSLRSLWAGPQRRSVSEHPECTVDDSLAVWPAEAPAPPKLPARGRWQRGMQRIRALWMIAPVNRFKAVFAVITALAGAGLVGLVLWGGSYTLLDTDSPSLPPSRMHPLGTNELGEDVLSLVALGGRQLALPLALALAITILLGGLFGTLSGLCLGTTLDLGMDLYAELWESIPKLVLVLAAITYMSFEHYVWKVYLLMGAAFIPLVYRAVRDEVGALRTSLFLEASATLGISPVRILGVHVLRNHALPVLCVEGAVMVGYLLLFDAILGYCRVRQYGEVLSWGSLVGTGLDDLPRLLDAGVRANPFVVWGPFGATLLAITVSCIAGDVLKSLSRSARFSR